jgi:putative FmdB family regulatory protein
MTYEYVCTACKHQWEAEQPISARPLKTCPQCGQDCAKRQISGGAGFILKGGGWYADGYGAPKPKTTDDGAGAKKSDAKSDAKTETKPESKTEKTESKSDSGSKESGGTKPTSNTQAA